MNMAEAMEYLTMEGIRLQSIGAGRSSVVLSTLLENGDVARMTLSVDLIDASEIRKPASAPQQPQQQQQQRPAMPASQQTLSGQPQQR